MGIEDMIDRFGTVAITVTRSQAGNYVNGSWTQPTSSVLTVNGLVQPLEPREMQLLPEGLASKHVYKIYTRDQLKTVDAANRTEADRVDWNGRKYVVETVEQYLGPNANYWRSLMSEVLR